MGGGIGGGEGVEAVSERLVLVVGVGGGALGEWMRGGCEVGMGGR